MPSEGRKIHLELTWREAAIFSHWRTELFYGRGWNVGVDLKTLAFCRWKAGKKTPPHTLRLFDAHPRRGTYVFLFNPHLMFDVHLDRGDEVFGRRAGIGPDEETDPGNRPIDPSDFRQANAYTRRDDVLHLPLADIGGGNVGIRIRVGDRVHVGDLYFSFAEPMSVPDHMRFALRRFSHWLGFRFL
jgi:hypothetical protein